MVYWVVLTFLAFDEILSRRLRFERAVVILDFSVPGVQLRLGHESEDRRFVETLACRALGKGHAS